MTMPKSTTPVSSKPKLSPQDTARLVRAVDERADLNGLRPRMWIDRLHDAAAKLADGQPSYAVATVFWLGLLGALDELIPYYGLFRDVPDPAKLQGDALVCHRVHTELTRLRDLFTEDERLYIHYRRDTEAHVWQKSYELSGHVDKPKLKEDRFYSLLGCKLPHDDVQERVRTVIRAHRVGKIEGGERIDELAIAVAFARRALPRIEAVRAALAPLYREG